MKHAQSFAGALLLIAAAAVAGLGVSELSQPLPSVRYAPANISGEAMHVLARVIPNPFDLETLFAQPNRAPVRVTAPYRVTVGATAVQLTSSGNVNGGVCIKALVPGQTMYLGVSSAVTTSTGWPMTDNESLCLEVINANVIYGIASAAAQSVAVLPFSRF